MDEMWVGRSAEEKVVLLEAEVQRLKQGASMYARLLAELRKRLSKTQDRLDHAKLESRKRAGEAEMLVRTLKVVWALWESFAFTGSILERLREAAEDLDENPEFLIATLQKYELLSRSDPPMPVKLSRKCPRKKVAEKK